MGTCAPHLPTCPLASFGVGSRGCRLGGAMAPLPGAADPLSHGEHNPLSSDGSGWDQRLAQGKAMKEFSPPFSR
jgi:hypothetical protein